MNAYVCPRHGHYQRGEHSPPSGTVTCVTCRSQALAAKDQAQREFDSQDRLWRRWEQAEIPARYVNRTLSNWVPSAGQEPAARIVRAWLDDVPARWEDGEGLLLMGAPGVGKTHLLAALVCACVQAGYSARYASWPDVWDRCKPPYDSDNPDALLRQLASVHFLALDEIGIRTGTDKEQARLFELIDTRYRDQLPTLVATNATEATLPMIGERTADRLREACIPVVIPGGSNRARAAGDQALKQSQPAISKPKPIETTCLISINGQEQEQQFRTRA